VFGKRAARAIAASEPEAPPKDALPAPPATTGGIACAPEAWAALRSACSDALGIERDAAGLASLDRYLSPLTEAPLPSDGDAADLRAAALCARLVARSALLRRESRGVHRRGDHPDTDPRWDGVRLATAGPP
jgi:L-aspartate oxidase